MSNSETSERYQLKIDALYEDEWLNFSILDGNKKLIAQETGSFSVDLPKGLYTILAETGSHRSREIVILNENKTLNTEGLIKKTTIRSTGDLNEEKRKYYSNIAKKQSLLVPEGTKDMKLEYSPLFIFMNVNKVDFKKKWLKIHNRFEILDNNYLPISNSKNREWNINTKEGWLSYHHLLEPGIYYLKYQGKELRTFAFELFKNNQTQILFDFNEDPNFSDFLIHLSPENYYEPNAKGYQSFEIALKKLNYKDFNISGKILFDLAFAKWVNPMYGLVASYIYLNGGSHKFDDLINRVVRNLDHSILESNNSTDLKLIKLLNIIHNKKVSDTNTLLSEITPIEDPPILRIGMENLIDLSFKYPNLIKFGSMVDLISDNLYYNSPWTSFKSIDTIHKDDSNEGTIYDSYFEPSDINFEFKFYYEDSDQLGYEEERSDNRVEIPAEIIEFLIPLVDIISKGNLGDQISKNILARIFKIPPITFERKIKAVKDIIKSTKNIELIIKDIVNKKIGEEIDEESLNNIKTTLESL